MGRYTETIRKMDNVLTLEHDDVTLQFIVLIPNHLE